MKAEGLPELGDAVQAGPHAFYRVAGDGRRFVYLPGTLDLASRPEPAGGPDFALELVRGEDPSAPPAPYGVLDFRLEAAGPTAEALASLREIEPQAVLVPPAFLGGYFRLQFLADAQERDPLLEEPTRLASNGLDTLRVLRRLTASQGVLLEHALGERTATVAGFAELEVAGVAPRATGRLELQPSALLAALAELADAQRVLTRARIVEFWIREPSRLPIVPVSGFDEGGASVRAEALADWTVERLGRFVPASSPDLPPTVRLNPAAPGDDEAVVWDMSVPRRVSRMIALRSDPFAVAQRVAAAQGLEAVCRKTVVPALQTGVVLISVGMNLPRGLQGVLRLGVDMVAPPRPPLRVHPLTASLLFDDPSSVQTVRWRFSPQEDVAFRVTTFALVRSGAGVARLAGRTFSHEGLSLLLDVDDFPMRFVPVRANPALLAEASVHGVGEYGRGDGGQPTAITFQLDETTPAVCLTLPDDADAGRLTLEARSLATGATVACAPLPLSRVQLDLYSFREYGPHRVAIETTFDRQVPLVAVDLQAEDAPAGEAAEDVTVIAFTPDRPRVEWTYFARSPFRPGYRYRWHETAGRVFAWSRVQSPFDPLRLNTSSQA